MGNVVGLVLADHQLGFVEGLTMLLDAEPTLTVLGVAYDGRQAVELAAKHRPVALLFDAYLSGDDLAGAVAAVKSASPGTKVLQLAPEARRIMVAAIASGADCLVTKYMSSRQVLATIHTGVTGKSVVVLAGQAPGLGRDASVGWLRLTTLSGREREVLGLLANGWSTRRIAQDCRVAESTVRGPRTEPAEQARRRLQAGSRRLRLGARDCGHPLSSSRCGDRPGQVRRPDPTCAVLAHLNYRERSRFAASRAGPCHVPTETAERRSPAWEM